MLDRPEQAVTERPGIGLGDGQVGFCFNGAEQTGN